MLFGAYRRGVLALLLLRPEESLHLREIARLLESADRALKDAAVATLSSDSCLCPTQWRANALTTPGA